MSRISEDRFRAGKRLWSAADDAVLQRTYPNESTATIAHRLRRTITSIYQRARIFSLVKSATYLASPAACRLRRSGDDHPGKATQFPKGHVPANKGTRRPGWAPGRMRETQFKPGQRSGKAAEHHMPIGSTRIADGYVYRKLADTPGVPHTQNWKLEHVLVWQPCKSGDTSSPPVLRSDRRGPSEGRRRMKALTICQPYAELIARGDKPIENRTWPTSYRGPLVIHAGKSRAWLGDDGEEAALYAVDVRAIPFGAIVAVAELVACLRLDLQWPERWEPLREHQHANGPFCWILENVRRVNPVPFRGAQGLFDLDWLPPCALTGTKGGDVDFIASRAVQLARAIVTDVERTDPSSQPETVPRCRDGMHVAGSHATTHRVCVRCGFEWDIEPCALTGTSETKLPEGYS